MADSFSRGTPFIRAESLAPECRALSSDKRQGEECAVVRKGKKNIACLPAAYGQSKRLGLTRAGTRIHCQIHFPNFLQPLVSLPSTCELAGQ